MGQRPESRFEQVLGKRIHYQLIHPSWLAGERPLLIFLHEGLGSIGQWKDFPMALSSLVKCPALVYDRYGYGLSDPLAGPRYPLYLHDEAKEYLPELLRKLGLDGKMQIPVGHSDGGSIALIYAATAGDRVAGVISEAAHVLVEPATINGLHLLEQEMENPRFLELLAKYHGDKIPYLVTSWLDNWLSLDSHDWNIEEYLPRIHCPVLIIQGEEDHFGSFAQVESIHRNTAGESEIFWLDRCGHVPHKEARERVLMKMSEFIRQLRDHPYIPARINQNIDDYEL